MHFLLIPHRALRFLVAAHIATALEAFRPSSL